MPRIQSRATKKQTGGEPKKNGRTHEPPTQSQNRMFACLGRLGSGSRPRTHQNAIMIQNAAQILCERPDWMDVKSCRGQLMIPKEPRRTNQNQTKPRTTGELKRKQMNARGPTKAKENQLSSVETCPTCLVAT